MFGSTETWVIATNTPDCPADVWHPLPSQLACVGDDEMLDFTSLNPEVLNPVLRYRTGDAGQAVACTCGRPGRALRVLGRRDNLILFRDFLLNVDDFMADLNARPGVARSQLVITDSPDGHSVMQVRLLADGPADRRTGCFRSRVHTTMCLDRKMSAKFSRASCQRRAALPSSS